MDLFVIEIRKYDRTIEHADGSRHRYGVRLTTCRGADRVDQVRCTGQTFQYEEQAHAYAQAQYSALRCAGVNTDMEYIGFPEED